MTSFGRISIASPPGELLLFCSALVVYLLSHFSFNIHPPPAFGSSPNLEILALEANKSEVQDGDSVIEAGTTLPRCTI
ncbi:hypothetical protein SASPL_118144 [Salvia splendens]|uniref:Uncharacterized protein n=1 Tax=Salvia splendens TaxID=180675 RepID=A0A8X8ZY68_SALSN|nr:hypothetical protein SASPL_118144 [Salvia splendens]